MPTRRQMLGGGAGSVAGVGAAAVLASCTPPPPAVAAQALRDALPHAQRLPARSGCCGTRTATAPSDIVHERLRPPGLVPGRPAPVRLARGPPTTAEGTWALWLCRVDGTLLHRDHQPAPSASPIWIRASARTGRRSPSAATRSASATAQGLWIVQPDRAPGCIRCPGAPAASRRASAPTASPSSTRPPTASGASRRRAAAPTLLGQGRVRLAVHPADLVAGREPGRVRPPRFGGGGVALLHRRHRGRRSRC